MARSRTSCSGEHPRASPPEQRRDAQGSPPASAGLWPWEGRHARPIRRRSRWRGQIRGRLSSVMRTFLVKGERARRRGSRKQWAPSRIHTPQDEELERETGLEPATTCLGSGGVLKRGCPIEYGPIGKPTLAPLSLEPLGAALAPPPAALASGRHSTVPAPSPHPWRRRCSPPAPGFAVGGLTLPVEPRGARRMVHNTGTYVRLGKWNPWTGLHHYSYWTATIRCG